VVDDSARADAAHDRGLADDRATLHTDRAEMDERDRVAERRLDGDRLPAVRHGAGERHHSLRGREHRRAGFRSDVEPAVLPGSVRVRSIEGERPQDRAVDRPGPRLCCRDGQSEETDDQDSETPHSFLLCCQS
jgi:hypothetical protein